MLPAYVPPCPTPPPGMALALDAGGTNVRAALVRFDREGGVVIENSRHAPLPGASGAPVTREKFFGALASLVHSVGPPDLPVGFVFSYPTRILPNRDGILLRWTKEINAPGVEGTRVGQGLSEALCGLCGRAPERMTVLNDTVATLSAGSTAVSGTGENIGLIVGTGTNMAYFEHHEALGKLAPGEAGPGLQAINIESGNFDELPMSCFDHGLDEQSADPGQQLFEKQVSGRYLGELARRVLRGAVGKNLLPGSITDQLGEPWQLETTHLAAALDNPARFEGPLCGIPESHREVAVVLMRAITERSAALVATVLDALIAHLGLAAAPVGIVAEGSTFWKMPGYRRMVETALDDLIPPIGSAPRFVTMQIDDANLIGAAVAALS